MSVAAPSLQLNITSYPLSSLSKELTQTARETAQIWAAKARSKGLEATSEQAFFKDCAIEAAVLSDCIEGPKVSYEQEFHLILCTDAYTQIQAIAMTYELACQLKIRFLVTHPENTSKKAGEAILSHLKAVMDQSKVIEEIAVRTFFSSIDFYTKAGFIAKKDARCYLLAPQEGVTTDRDIFCEMHLPKK